jgi:hypothetical protein
VLISLLSCYALQRLNNKTLTHVIMKNRRLFDGRNTKTSRGALITYVAIISLSYFVIPASGLINSPISQVMAQPVPATPTASTADGLPTIQITSVQDDMQVPPGELTIQGISSDTEDTDCQVFADVNDVGPMQNVTAAGVGGDEEDFSTWTFTYTENYQLISPGQNELTAKISCTSGGEGGLNAFPGGSGAGTTAAGALLNEWHTVNVTGVAGAPPATVSPPIDGANGSDGVDGADGGEGADGLEDGDGGIEEDIPSLFG